MYLYYRAKTLLLLSHVPILQSQVSLASITCTYTTEPSHSCFYHMYLYYRAKSLFLLSHVLILQCQVTLASITCTYTYTSSYAGREHVHGPDRHMMHLFHHLNTLSMQQQRKRCKVIISCFSIHTCTSIYKKKCSHTYLYSVNCCPRDYTCTYIRTHACTHTCTSHKHMPLVIMRTIRIHPHTSKQAIMQDCCHSLGNPRLQS